MPSLQRSLTRQSGLFSALALALLFAAALVQTYAGAEKTRETAKVLSTDNT